MSFLHYVISRHFLHVTKVHLMFSDQQNNGHDTNEAVTRRTVIDNDAAADTGARYAD